MSSVVLIEGEGVRIYEMEYVGGHYVGGGEIKIPEGMMYDMIKWSKYEVNRRIMMPMIYGDRWLALIEQRHSNMLLKRVGECMTTSEESKGEYKEILPGPHRLTKQRTVNNTVTYIEKRIHHVMRHVQKDPDTHVGIMACIYIPRHKEREVGEKLLNQVMIKHKYAKDMILLSDHHSGTTLVCVNIKNKTK